MVCAAQYMYSPFLWAWGICERLLQYSNFICTCLSLTRGSVSLSISLYMLLSVSTCLLTRLVLPVSSFDYSCFCICLLYLQLVLSVSSFAQSLQSFSSVCTSNTHPMYLSVWTPKFASICLSFILQMLLAVSQIAHMCFCLSVFAHRVLTCPTMRLVILPHVLLSVSLFANMSFTLPENIFELDAIAPPVFQMFSVSC
jgi:hypothetical protein